MAICKQMSKDNNHLLYIKSVNLDSYNFEHKAREVRYKFFNSIKNLERYDFILTGHHRDDLIETLYMQNTSIDDYSCIPLNQELNGILRPLIGISKKEIQEQTDLYRWKYVDDPTNEDTKYKRNRVRHQILPNLENKENIVDEMISLYREKLGRYNSFIMQYNIDKPRVLSEKKNQIQIDREYLRKIDVYAFKLILQGELKASFDTLSLKSEKFWKELHSMVLSNKVGGIKRIDSRVTLYAEEKHVVLIDMDENHSCIRLENNANWKGYTFKVEKYRETDKLNLKDKNIFICTEEVYKKGLYVRKKQDGDRYTFRADMNKNISDLFNEHKIPVSNRENSPIVASENEIKWIPGLAHASNDYLQSNNLIKVRAKNNEF